MDNLDMKESEEQDTCRICSAPAEQNQPLFYPCKCSGTIRYIHQDCLTTWLAHSKKKHCDVCKHPYSFTKVYAQDMPTRLPTVLLIRQLAQQCLFAILLGVRAVAVAIIWLAVLPWVTVWTWRMYFSVGDSAAWWISDRPRPPSTSPTLPDFLLSTLSSNPTHSPGDSFLIRLTSHPSWVTLSSDIFKGQIIATLIVLTFVAVFLLREWISQNARPGVFEDDEVVAERDRPAAQVQPPVAPAPAPPPVALPLGTPHADQLADIRQNIGALDNHPIGDRPVDERGQARRLIRRRPSVSRRSEGTKMPEDPSSQELRYIRTRRRPGSGGRPGVIGDPPDSERMRKRSFSRRLHTARLSGLQRRLDAASPTSSSETDLGLAMSREFEFTFRSSSRLPRRTMSEQRSQRQRSSTFNAESSPSSSTHFPPVELQPPRSPIPFELSSSPVVKDDRPDSSTSSLRLPTVHATHTDSFSLSSSFSGSDSDWVSSFSSPYGSQHRPPLPDTPLISAGDRHSSPEMGTSSTDKSISPLPSPGLTTFRPPEEFEAGPSRYSPDLDSASTSWEDEQDVYFRENKAESSGSAEGLPQSTLDSGPADDINQASIIPDTGNDTEDEDEDEIDDALVWDDDEEVDLEILEGVGWDPEAAVANVPAPAAPAVVEPPQQEAVEPAPPEANDEQEGNVEDDMEGAMEAIGIRGPIFGVFQNAALMIFVLDTAIGLGVWVPFTIGKSTALLSLDPYRFLQLLHFPIRAMRIITDPVVDFILFLLVQFGLPFLRGSACKLVSVLALSGAFIISQVVGQTKLEGVVESFAAVNSRVAVLVRNPGDLFSAWSTISPNPNVPVEPTSSSLEPIVQFVVTRLEPRFALIGEKARDTVTCTRATWTRMALGQGPSERAFAVVLGYAVVGLLLSLYLNILTVGNVRSAGRAVKNAVRQQLLVIKVAAFIFIELVTFPLGCGIVLDFCTVWLFPEVDLATRMVYFVRAPLTATFYHWVAGTMFMYSFAVLLSSCRSVMRPGAMWFIKDPQDQNSHPIRDILDRPTLVQLRKIFVSGVMYSFVVACVVGSISGLLVLGNRSILPIRWKIRKPLSSVPIDLLFLHQVLPYTVHYFRPKRVVRSISTSVWRILAGQLRLSSYFFGGRYHDEEYPAPDWLSVFRATNRKGAPDDTTRIRDGSFRRVPNTDHIALPRDMRATAKVDETGEPLDDEARELMKIQDLEAEKAKRNVKDDYIIVYIPPHFRYRVISFILCFWGVAAAFLGLFLAAPLQLGRAIFRLISADDVHDGYSFMVGFYVLWACYLVGKTLDKLDKRRRRKHRTSPRAPLALFAFKRGILWVMTISYMIICLGVVIPILISLVVDLYIILPFRFMIDPHMVPRVRIVDQWALGVVYSNIVLHCYQLQPGNRLSVGLQNVVKNGWTRPNPRTASKEIIAPVIGGLLGMAIFPAIIFGGMRRLLPGLCADNKVLFIHIYSAIFAIAGFVRLAVVFAKFGSTWSQAVRDKEFLVEMRLHNLEPDKQKSTADEAPKETPVDYQSNT